MNQILNQPPVEDPDVGAIVCNCFRVGEKTIKTAIETHGLTTVEEVGNYLEAGTHCGSCIAEIEAML
jgi:assimilatory nitrate reductase catalytic subunit